MHGRDSDVALKMLSRRSMTQRSIPHLIILRRCTAAPCRDTLAKRSVSLAIEHWGAHGKDDWIVPAFLFRFHETEFQHIDEINARLKSGIQHDPDADRERRPGRTGDDGIAFRISEQNVITDILAIEAKCLTTHSPGKLQEAHEKLNSGTVRPTAIRELVELLRDYKDAEAERWVEALVRLWVDPSSSTRHDGVVYACGERPKLVSRPGWMNAATPHEVYKATRRLEGLEFHFRDLAAVIDGLYRE